MSVENFKVNLGGPQPTESQDDLSPGKTFGRSKVTCHHNEPRVQLHVPKEETFPVPLKYIDVTRAVLEENVLTMIGMWTRIEVYQILGKDSPSSLC